MGEGILCILWKIYAPGKVPGTSIAPIPPDSLPDGGGDEVVELVALSRSPLGASTWGGDGLSNLDILSLRLVRVISKRSGGTPISPEQRQCSLS